MGKGCSSTGPLLGAHRPKCLLPPLLGGEALFVQPSFQSTSPPPPKGSSPHPKSESETHPLLVRRGHAHFRRRGGVYRGSGGSLSYPLSVERSPLSTEGWAFSNVYRLSTPDRMAKRTRYNMAGYEPFPGERRPRTQNRVCLSPLSPGGHETISSTSKQGSRVLFGAGVIGGEGVGSESRCGHFQRRNTRRA